MSKSEKLFGVSDSYWEILLEKSTKLYELKPWEVLFNEEPIEFFNPFLECSSVVNVMGGLGSIFGLAIHDSFNSYDKFLKYSESYSFVDFVEFQFINLFFEEKKLLRKSDKEIYKKFKFEKKYYPTFISKRFGRTAGVINESDAEIIIRAIDAVISRLNKDSFSKKDYSEKFPKQKAENGFYFLPWLKTSDQGLLSDFNVLKAEFLNRSSEELNSFLPILTTELELAFNKSKRVEQNWEIDFKYVNTPTGNEVSGYYPLMLTLIDSASFFLLGVEMLESKNDIPKAIEQMLLKSISKYGRSPASISYRVPDLEVAIKTLSRKVSVVSKKVKSLPATLSAQEALEENLAGL